MEIRSKPSSLCPSWTDYELVTDYGYVVSSCTVNPITGDCANVKTDMEFRREGHMTYLLYTLIQQGLVKYVQVRPTNHIALALYKKLGFVIEKEYTSEVYGEMYSMVYPG